MNNKVNDRGFHENKLDGAEFGTHGASMLIELSWRFGSEILQFPAT